MHIVHTLSPVFVNVVFFLSPFSHYYTVRLTLRGLRAGGDVSTSPFKTLHALV